MGALSLNRTRIKQLSAYRKTGKFGGGKFWWLQLKTGHFLFWRVLILAKVLGNQVSVVIFRVRVWPSASTRVAIHGLCLRTRGSIEQSSFEVESCVRGHHMSIKTSGIHN